MCCLTVVPEFLRVTAASIGLFGIVGLGVTRFALPEGLRRHEWLWIVPVGAVTTAFAMTPLGFAGVPYAVNLALVLGLGAILSVAALVRHGLPQRPQFAAVAWPAYLAALLLAIALVPLFRAGFATVIGDGSDAHLAAGTAEFLEHARPGTVDASLPVDQVPLVWRSKPPIYYAFAAVSTLSGLETYEVLSVLCALVLALAAVGWFVLSREVLGATVSAAALAMFVAGLLRMVIHTGIHPYFNQTWGYMTVPFALTLSWSLVRAPAPRTLALLGLFLAVCAFAYPLAVPIPLLALAVMWLMTRPAVRVPRRALWALPLLVVLLAVPAYGVWEKIESGVRLVVDPGYSLDGWGGDMHTWFPERQFFGLHFQRGWWLALLVIAAFAARELWRLPRPARFGLLSVIAAGVLVAVDMRLRDYGWYFHFKMLAFAGPLVVVLAVVGMVRARGEAASAWVRWGVTALLAVWVLWTGMEARTEVDRTSNQLPRTMLALRDWAAELPAGSSIRLDMTPAVQLWPAYMLSERRLCSEHPLTRTTYPHVPVSTAADYVLVRGRGRPADAAGSALRDNREFQLYRLRSGLPGGDRCSQRMVQTVTRIGGG